MDEHAVKDKQYHADIAAVYDYITNEPRQYPNELIFRPIDRLVKPTRLMLDLGCGTGHMLFRYGHLAERIIAVDHSPEMIAQARQKAKVRGWDHIEFVVQDLDVFLDLNPDLRAGLVTCVGVLHHLEQHELDRFIGLIASLLGEDGQLLVAEPVYADKVPDIVRSRNARSILPKRLAKCMPQGVADPDEEPLKESSLINSLNRGGLSLREVSKGFELFHVSEPITPLEKLVIRYIYWRYRSRGDVVAVLAGL